MRGPSLALLGLGLVLLAGPGLASSPIGLSPSGDAVWVVNPDSGTVAQIDPGTNTRVQEVAVGAHPRTVTVTSRGVYVTNQSDDTVQRVGGASAALPFGCAPYGIAASAGGDQSYLSCPG